MLTTKDYSTDDIAREQLIRRITKAKLSIVDGDIVKVYQGDSLVFTMEDLGTVIRFTYDDNNKITIEGLVM